MLVSTLDSGELKATLLPTFIFKFIKMQWLIFLLMLFSVLAGAVLSVVFPYIIKIIINIVAHHEGYYIKDAFSLLGIPLIWVCVVWFGMEFCRRFFGLCMIYAIPQFRTNIRKFVFDYASRHSVSYFADRLTGEIADKISSLPRDCEIIIMLASRSFIPFIVSFALSLTIAAKVNSMFLLVFLIWAIIHLGANIMFAKRCNMKAAFHADTISTLSGRVVDIFTNIINITIFAHRLYEQQDFLKYQDEEVKTGRASLWEQEKIKFIQSGISFLMIVGITCLLVSGWRAGNVSVGDFSLVFMLAFNILGFAVAMSYQTTMLYRKIGSAKSALDMVFRKHEVIDTKDAQKLTLTKGIITFNQVGFSYDKNNPVFQNLSINLQPGEKVGLVGHSGAGKTTFIKLLLRLYDLDNGSISIDNQNIANVEQDSLRQNIAVISQEPLLFSRSLMDNIRYGRVCASDDEVIEAAKLAHCHDFIMQTNKRYETVVGERGIKLSGGQRQSIAIARAFLEKTKILILDEATSSLDSKTEEQIQESFDILMREKTTIVISHRLLTLSKMDRILVFNNGKIIEDGSITTLLCRGSNFKKLWDNLY